MRTWHRWLSLFFGLFMLWTAATGVLSQIVPLTQPKPPAQVAGAPKPALSKLQPDFQCPADVMCRPKRKGTNIVGYLHHLHSG